jgi:hypothetical protein
MGSGMGAVSDILAMMGLGKGATGFADVINKWLSGGSGGGMGGGSVDPITGQVTYGSGLGSSIGVGDQGGWPGDTSGIDFTGAGGGLPADIWTSGSDLLP